MEEIIFATLNSQDEQLLSQHRGWLKDIWVNEAKGHPSAFSEDSSLLGILRTFIKCNIVKKDETFKIHAYGVVFGDELIKGTEDFSWVVVQEGSQRQWAIQSSKTAAYIFPLALMAEKFANDQEIDVYEMVEEFSFRLKYPDTDPDAKLREIKALAASLSVPSIRLLPSDKPSRSHLGGEPHLPPEILWPQRNGNKLGFLARISLAELQQIYPISWLPTDGALLFFYDIEEQPWGYEPQDRGGWAVLHVPDLQAPLAASSSDVSDGCAPHIAIGFHSIQTLPSTYRPDIEAQGFTYREDKAYWSVVGGYDDETPNHQIDGFAAVIQEPHMELMCQLISHGIDYLEHNHHEDPRAIALEEGSSEWRLLLQLDYDERFGDIWGDGGTFFFWVQAEESAAGRFDNCWLIKQCG